jgi:hypothetical protein
MDSKSGWRFRGGGKGKKMNDPKNKNKRVLLNAASQKWLVIVNTFLVLALVVIFIIAGTVWFSDRIMLGLISQVVGPRFNSLIQKNPEALSDLTKKLNPESMALLTNNLLQKDQKLLSRYVKSIDPVLVAGALNHVFKENQNQFTLLLNNLDPQSLADLKNHVLVNNKTLFVALLSSLDYRAVGQVMDEIISNNPLLFSDVLGSLHPLPASKAANKTFRGQTVFLSNFIGSLDMGSLVTIIDKIAKDHPEFMNELVDKIVELIRKDFMKSGI